jgi:outer membrane protein OmpU
MKHEGKTMKKVLFATTALVAFAGAAAAEVSISGSAEMGIADGGDNAELAFFQSVDVRFSMSGTADNGLSFGAIIDLEDAADTARTNRDMIDVNGDFADYTVFISGDFGRLTMGDTDGAIDWAMDDAGNIGNPGSIADDETGHAGYLGFGGGDSFDGIYNGQVARYDYSVGAFGFAFSAEIDEDPLTEGDPIFQIGFTYALEFGGGRADFGLGYGTVGDLDTAGTPGDQGVDITALSAAVFLDSGLSAGITYTDISDEGAFGGDGEHIGVGIGYTFDAFSVHANWGEYDWDATAASQDRDGWGISAAYVLGGGLSAHVGYGDSSYGALNDIDPADAGVNESTWSFGLAMSF